MTPTVCTPISSEIASLKIERADLQQQLQSASTAQKSQLAAAIKQLNTQLTVKADALARCIKQHTLVAIDDQTLSQVLDWSLDGSWRVWNYAATTVDIFPGAPTRSGQWNSIDDTHVLVSMPQEPFTDVMQVLDWVPTTGTWRLWNYIPSAPDVLATLVRKGTWSTIRSGHVLLPITTTTAFAAVNHVLDWVPATGTWRLWNYDPEANDVLPGKPVQQGTWTKVKPGHVLLPMGRGKILEWAPKDGSWRLWNYDPNASDILAGTRQTGQWGTIKSGHVLQRMPDNKILDWVPGVGSWRLWNYDPSAIDILSGPPIQHGQWSSIY